MVHVKYCANEGKDHSFNIFYGTVMLKRVLIWPPFYDKVYNFNTSTPSFRFVLKQNVTTKTTRKKHLEIFRTCCRRQDRETEVPVFCCIYIHGQVFLGKFSSIHQPLFTILIKENLLI